MDIYACSLCLRMDWWEIVSWYPIDGVILGMIFLVGGITQHDQPLGMGNDGGPRWHHNPQVSGS